MIEMILVLTYHKVLREVEPKPEFYTVEAEHLETQLDTLARSGFDALAPTDLLNFQSRQRPGYVLTFDDGTLDHYEVVAPIVERHRVRAIFFVPTAKLGRAGYMTSEQVADLGRAGHTLGLHSHEHRRLDWLMEEDIRVQMDVSRQILGELAGSPPVMFAPVGGFMDRRVKRVALESGVQVIRTMHWGYNRRCDVKELECIPLNRFVDQEQFSRVLRMRSRSLLYAAKQVTKKMVPGVVYERLREWVFKLLGRGQR